MSIDSVLAELVSQVEGATGAILVAADGEAVQWHPPADGAQQPGEHNRAGAHRGADAPAAQRSPPPA